MRYILRDEATRADSPFLFPFALAMGCLFALLGIGSAARAEGRNPDDLWRPSAALQVAMAVRNFDSDLSSTPIMGPPLPGQPLRVDSNHGPTTVWFPAGGSATNVTPVVSGVLELMSPRITKRAWSPRFFIDASIDSDQGPERDLAKTGVPGVLQVNPEALAFSPFFPENSISGQGAVTSIDIKPSAYTVGAGVAFSMDVGERRVRIKPSVQFSSFRVRYSGVTSRAVDQLATGLPDNIDDFRLITLGVGKTEKYNAIGPALEVELDTARYGPLTLGVYIKGSLQAILGNTSFDMSASNEYGETGFYDFEIERYGYRVGTGFRISWVPE